MQTAAAAADLEDFLIEQGAITGAQLERARRIASKLERPRRPSEVLVDLGHLSRTDYERLVRTYRAKLSLVRILREEGSLDEAGEAAYEEARRKSPSAGDRALLVVEGRVSEEAYLRAICAREGLSYLEPEVGLADMALLAKTSIPYLMRNRVLPLRVVDGSLPVVLADPHDLRLLGELERIFKVPLKLCCAPSAKIQQALETLERLRDGRSSAGAPGVQYREIREANEREVTGEGAVPVLDYLLLRAVRMRASDLHVEPMREKVRVRARVDGVLQAVSELPADFAPQIASRVKVLAGADIAERRLHQDGRIFVKVEGREIDIRVSTYASVFGENLVLRILDRQKGIVPLEELGFHPHTLSVLRDQVLRASSGLVLVTGPTGSGKTTTLYSFVDFVNGPDLKIISCEDPVEYVLEGLVQCAVNQKTGPTFADSLRAIVRQDPDVIVVGEIRDAVTSELAVEAALTGHKVLTTFHTEDAIGASLRLLEMGVEPFLIASTLSCVVAQRLVRRVCVSCRRPGDPSREALRFLGLSRADLAGAALVEGAGCDACDHTGYHGRVGIHEVLLPDDDFRDAILRRASGKDLRALARKLDGFFTLQEDGIMAAVNGVTTIAEIAANVPRDDGARRPLELRDATPARRNA